MLVEARGPEINEDTPLMIALAVLALAGERALRKHAPAPWNEEWRPKAIAWSGAAVLIVLYFFVLKPAFR